MLEYVFFDESIRNKFADFLREKGVDFRLTDEDGACIAEVPEDLDDEIGIHGSDSFNAETGIGQGALIGILRPQVLQEFTEKITVPHSIDIF